MILTYGFRLVLIILLFNVALQETGVNSLEMSENYVDNTGIDWEVDDVVHHDEVYYDKSKEHDDDGYDYEEGGDDEHQEKHSNIGEGKSSSSSDEVNHGTEHSTFRWPSGTVPYVINGRDYDAIISGRIRKAMLIIQRSSCVIFKDMSHYKNRTLKGFRSPWLSIENPDMITECTHKTSWASLKKIVLRIGYNCIHPRDIMHSLMHALGFKDEVTHPQRDLYIRVVWPNIQLKYRPLFYAHKEENPNKTMEFDSMSVMHFHDRAYTINGGPTILPQIPGLLIAPTDTLSQLDVMKLRLAFGHECNKRKVANILRTCLSAIKNKPEE